MKRITFLLAATAGLSVSFLAGRYTMAAKAGRVIAEKQDETEKFRKFFAVLDEWLWKKQQGKSVESFLAKNQYHSVAVYGMGRLGERLASELKGGSVNLSYGIDKRDVQASFPIYRLEDTLPEVDAVIVTLVSGAEEIGEALRKKVKCPIFSIEDIIYFME